MYGVPKFKENIFLRYKKEILLSVGALLTMASVIRFAPGNNTEEIQSMEANGASAMIQIEQEQVIGYEVVVNGAVVGVIQEEMQINSLLEQAYDQMKEEIGYDPEIAVEPALIPLYEGELSLNTSDIVKELKDELYNTIDVVKQQAYVMRIGQDFTIALENEEDIEKVLCSAQSKITDTNGVDFEVSLTQNQYSTMVMIPKLLMVDRGLNTASGATVLKEIDFAEEIIVVQAYVNPEDLVDVDTATELITKENEEEKIYVVESGDYPGRIAERNDMTVSDLFALNPGLESRQRSIKIGEELVVMVPEPELKVETKEEIKYEVPIYRGTRKVDDPDNYISHQSVVNYGSDGVMEVTAVVTKINGEEIGREIVNKERLVEPVNKVIAVGTKPFPVKGATGNYVYPVSGYIITSYFGYRGSSFHHGLDLAVAWGTPFWAADGGTVTFAGWKNYTYGYFVEIDHGNGVTTRYAHCSKVRVSVGQQVAKGEIIANVGSSGKSTGPHIHFEIRFNGTAANPTRYLE